MNTVALSTDTKECLSSFKSLITQADLCFETLEKKSNLPPMSFARAKDDLILFMILLAGSGEEITAAETVLISEVSGQQYSLDSLENHVAELLDSSDCIALGVPPSLCHALAMEELFAESNCPALLHHFSSELFRLFLIASDLLLYGIFSSREQIDCKKLNFSNRYLSMISDYLDRNSTHKHLPDAVPVKFK